MDKTVFANAPVIAPILDEFWVEYSRKWTSVFGADLESIQHLLTQELISLLASEQISLDHNNVLLTEYIRRLSAAGIPEPLLNDMSLVIAVPFYKFIKSVTDIY